MAANPEVIRVGFVGASFIAHKVWAAIEAAGSLQVTYVGSRSAESATKFVKECVADLGITDDRAPRVGTYDDVVTSPEVDVVYISIPTSARHEWVMKCVENGKHVVGEKPPAVSGEQLREWLEALNSKHLLYMDGTMFSHGAVIEKVMQNVHKVGRVRRITSTLAWMASAEVAAADIRFKPELEPMGVLGDCGWYCVRAILHVMNFAMPVAVIGRVLERAPNGAIISFSGELTFSDEATSEVTTGYFYCAFNSAAEDELIVSGTEATLEAPNLVLPITDKGPAHFTVYRNNVEQQKSKLLVEHVGQVTEVTQETGHYQETQMWRDVRDCLRRDADGKLLADEKESHSWGRKAWMTQCILDKLLESAGPAKS